MIRDHLTFDIVKQRFVGLLNEENSPRSHMITAVFLLASQKHTDISLRAILKIAGYAASKFYKYWPGRSSFILDAYLYCVEKYIDAEVSFAHEFSGSEPRQFFELIGQHTMLSQKYIHRDFFREIAGQMAGGEYSRLLVHMESQIKRNLDVFIEKFPQYSDRVNVMAGQSMVWTVGTYILIRNYDDGLRLITDEQMVDLIVEAYARCIDGGIQMHGSACTDVPQTRLSGSLKR